MFLLIPKISHLWYILLQVFCYWFCKIYILQYNMIQSLGTELSPQLCVIEHKELLIVIDHTMSSSEINISTKAFIWIHHSYPRFPSTLPKYLSPLPRVIFPKSLQRSLYHHLEGRIGFNTVNPSLSTGEDYPVHSLMMNRMAVRVHRIFFYSNFIWLTLFSLYFLILRTIYFLTFFDLRPPSFAKFTFCKF